MKERSYFRFLSLAGPLFGALLASGADAEPLRFALVAKRVDHPFFIQAGEGCAEAARAQGDTCLLLGSAGPTHFRRQNQVLEQALDMGLDGIALSVTYSQWLADHALKRASRTPSSPSIRIWDPRNGICVSATSAWTTSSSAGGWPASPGTSGRKAGSCAY
ncbi:substrate-binding domain-containing protein [Azorhizophilus paspali]|uniref:substrate-binding domain-containing protein n=1 Tax=Azorhizophilus paspali TaxID=69963 RepID=UPI0036330368